MKRKRKREGCYWCGGPATTREHVPPKCLFPKDERENLITVPSCKEHNVNTAKLDEKFAIYLRAPETNQIAYDGFVEKIVPALKRPEAAGLLQSYMDRTSEVVVNGKRVLATNVSKRETQTFFGKIMRALYFIHVGRRATGRTAACSPHFQDPTRIGRQMLSRFGRFYEIMERGLCANPRVFDYRYAIMSKDQFLIIMTFYEGVHVIGMVGDPQHAQTHE